MAIIAEDNLHSRNMAKLIIILLFVGYFTPFMNFDEQRQNNELIYRCSRCEAAGEGISMLVE